jgi:hypothetical protein
MLLWGGDSSNVIVGTGGAYVHALDDDLDGFTECQGDCDETDATVYGNAPQLCDGLNNDCNDPAWPTVPSLEADADHDQFSICAGDCDDSRSTVYPGAPELCDVLDNNCNQIVDEDANGLDTDADGLRNACDNCVAISNADQLDDDADGAGNVCDCRPLDPTAKQSPASFFPLAMAPDRATISWSSFGAQVGSSTLYDVLRGQVAEWPVGAGASESCRASNTTQSSIQDSAVPPPGPGYYYLIRGRNVCGTGGYGFASDGTPEVSSACP